ncbi:MAG: hypothetical protein IT317_04955 [Anaerolineales bacterium]|nr:hypothetical protein [Anaerolineales bacterium]
MMRQTWLILIVIGLLCAACGAAGEPSPTATLVVLPTPPATRPPTASPPPVDTPLPAPSNTRPPTAELTLGGLRQTSAIGTYCWRNLDDVAAGVGLCLDVFGILTPREPLAVPSGPLTAQFALPLAEPPTSAALWVYPAAGEPSAVAGGETLAWPPPATDSIPLPLEVSPTVELNLADGVYVLALFVQWQSVGDVMYGYLVQVGDPQPTPQSAGAEPPATCPAAGADETLYLDPAGRFCLLYPARFRTGDVTADRVNLSGPPLDASVEPVFALLTIEVLGPSDGRALAAVVDSYLAGAAVAGAPMVDRQPAQWGGEPAELLSGLPGLPPSRQLIVIHAATVYHVALLPYDVTALPALPDVEDVWAVVSQSFTFLNPP